MFTNRLAIWLATVGVFALLGNLSYVYMERKLRTVAGYRPKILKWPKDFWNVYSQYSSISAASGGLPRWPSRSFLISLVVVLGSAIYLFLMPNPFK
jgi:hypothetical protein